MDYRKKVTMDASGFVLLSDYVPAVIQEIRYFSTYNFVGESNLVICQEAIKKEK